MSKVEKLRCVFNPKRVCTVRTEMERQRTLAGLIKPKALTDDQRVAWGVTQAFSQILSLEWGALSNFCQQCPKKFELTRRRIEPPREIQFPTPSTLPKGKECSKCQQTYFGANYCPKCGSKLE